MALAWVLRDQRVTSALVGASSVAQLEANVAALEKLEFTQDELDEIDKYATDSGINLWAVSSAAASPKTFVCRSTSASVVAGDISAMLWNGVSRIPRLSA